MITPTTAPSGRLTKLRKTFDRHFRNPRPRLLVLACVAAISLVVFAAVHCFRPTKNIEFRRDLAAAHAQSTRRVSSSANSFWKGPPILPRHEDELKWNYLATEKGVPYVGSPHWLKLLPQSSRGYVNSLAVFKESDSSRRMHGLLGLRSNGTEVWQPAVMPPTNPEDYEGGKKAAFKNGGFYLDLSNALPLDRAVPDNRESVCRNVNYDYSQLPDASIVITFFNEPISTLLRTVYSVLNYTPPPLLREIILVDDHSDLEENLPGGPLYDHVSHLPKVKLMRMHERQGIVHARIAGAKAAKGEVLLVLDSHIEVNPGWIEPQLDRIRESPESIVFPQILSLTHDTLEHKATSGIGCFLTFRWSVVEQASLTGKVTSAAVVPSPSMAGGLFAVDRNWFWELGGYDEGFVAWGAENVEMAFRAWMCGGKVECAPCSKTYHIYRKGGAGYSNPQGALWRNRKRTARVWMDEYYQVASKLIDISAAHPSVDDFGDINQMLQLKQRLGCKPFKWYLQNVAKDHDLQELSDVMGLGRIAYNNTCMDLKGGRAAGSEVTAFRCHSEGKYSANQGFLISRGDNRIRIMANDKRCVSAYGGKIQLEQCTDSTKSPHWNFVKVEDSRNSYKLIWAAGGKKQKCLSLLDEHLTLRECDEANEWEFDKFEDDPKFELPKYTPRSMLRKARGALPA